MRVLFVTNPGLGHLHPMVPFASAFLRAEHQVAFATGSSLERRVTELGFEFIYGGLDWDESNLVDSFPEIASKTLEELHLWHLVELFVGRSAEPMAETLLRVAKRWRPNLIVHNDFEFGSPIVSEKTGLPRVTIGLGVYISGEGLASVIGSQFNELRAKFGCSKDPHLQRLYGQIYVSLYPRAYHFEDSRFPVPFLPIDLAKSPSPESLANHNPPPWIREVGRQPTVLASLGTVFSRLPEVTTMFGMIQAAVVNEPVDVVITTGATTRGGSAVRTSENVWTADYVPHSYVLPLCSAVLTQGGSATTRAGLRAGLPTVLLPLAGEDMFHAMRCLDLGLGRVVAPMYPMADYLPKTRFDELGVDGLRNAIRSVLFDPIYRSNARKLANSMTQLPGPGAVVKQAERLVRGSAHDAPLHL